MIRRVVLVLLTLSTGGFMLVDGTRNLFTGTHFGSTLGPWSNLVRATGLDPHHFGAVFVILGLAWFLTLWHLPVGTVLCSLPNPPVHHKSWPPTGREPQNLGSQTHPEPI